MAHLNNKIFNMCAKPMIYARYIDGISILDKKLDEIKSLRGEFGRNSVRDTMDF